MSKQTINGTPEPVSAIVAFASILVFPLLALVLAIPLFSLIMWPIYLSLHYLFHMNIDSSYNPFLRFFFFAWCFGAILLAQFSSWIALRRNLSSSINATVLVVFAVYASAAFGLLRYELEEAVPTSYNAGADIRHWLRQTEHNRLIAAIAKSQADNALLAKAAAEISPPACVPLFVVHWLDHLTLNVRAELARRAMTAQHGRSCMVIVIRRNGALQYLVDSVRGVDRSTDAFTLFIQPGDLDNKFELFLAHKDDSVAWIPGTHEVLGIGSLRAVLADAYAAPEKNTALFKSLIASRISWEVAHENRIKQQLNRLTINADLAPVPLTEFVVVTVAQFFEALDSYIVPVTLLAQLLDISFSLIRFLFVVIYLESLARGQ